MSILTQILRIRCPISPNNVAVQQVFVAGLKSLTEPPDYSNVEFPEKPKLKHFEKVPIQPPNLKPRKITKRLTDIRGPELVHNKLLHDQYGLIATVGGNLHHGHIEMIRHVINRKMDQKNMFAVWRIDGPWKPITRKSQGKRMGGGKGNIHHYVTPVKAGRVIFEMGGTVEYEFVKPLLVEVAQKMPMKCIPVSKAILEEMAEAERRKEEANINPYTFEYICKNNMLGCHSWISPYDLIWHGKYR